jgi:hypothetical protein
MCIQGDPEGPVQHVCLPDGWMQIRPENRQVNPPKVPNILNAVRPIGKKIHGKFKNERVCEKAKRKKIKKRRKTPMLQCLQH